MKNYLGLLFAGALLAGCEGIPYEKLPEVRGEEQTQTQAPPPEYEITSSRFLSEGGRLVANVKIDGQKMVGAAYDDQTVNARNGNEFRLVGQGGEIIRIAGNQREGATWFLNRNNPSAEFWKPKEEDAECPWHSHVYGDGKDVSCDRAVELGREASRIYDGLAPLLAAEFERKIGLEAVARRQDSDLEKL